MASYTNLFVDQGSDFTTLVNVLGQDDTPLDLTNVTLKGQIRKSYGSTVAYEMTIDKIDAAGGVVQVRVLSNVTDTMSTGRYVYDIFARDLDEGTQFKVLEGILEIVPRVTQFSD